MKAKLLKRLPKKYHHLVSGFYSESGLIDDCKFMLLFTDGYGWHGEFESVPCKSISEAINFIKEAEKLNRR